MMTYGDLVKSHTVGGEVDYIPFVLQCGCNGKPSQNRA